MQMHLAGHQGRGACSAIVQLRAAWYRKNFLFQETGTVMITEMVTQGSLRRDE